MTGVKTRTEMIGATLDFGGRPIDLSDYATTGLRMIAVGPSGSGKTNAGLLACEQLAKQGWICVLVDPEMEIRSMYGEPVASPEDLAIRLRARDQPFVVVDAADAEAFNPYGEVVAEIADAVRKPVVVMIDEGQLFSASRDTRRRAGTKEATDLVNDFMARGRKRALDCIITCHRFTGSINRSLFANMNLTLVGTQADPTAWNMLAPQFRTHKVTYADAAALAPGEFYCFSRRGLDKFRLPLARALAAVALPARAPRQTLPTNFAQWDRAVSAMSLERLEALSDSVTDLLSAIAGLTPAQVAAGRRVRDEELDAR